MSKAILVTGASTGIGRDIAEQLSKMGHIVYATARRESDLQELSAIEHVHALELDVSKPDQIERARAYVESQETGLFGLINNAGIGPLGQLSTFSDEDMHQLFNVNVFGPHRMTNAFLEFLVESKGRVVNIGSQGGQIAMAFYGPYTMTKHALEAYTIALDQEISPHGMRALIVQPGGIKTPIGAKMLEPSIKHLERAKPPFDEDAKAVMNAMQNTTPYNPDESESASNRNPSEPSIVTEAVLDALFSENPQKSYLVGTQWEGDRVIDATIEKLVAANDCESMKYSRDELVAKLDEVLSNNHNK